MAEFVLLMAFMKHHQLSAGDVIEMFVLPDGARIISGSLAHDTLGSSTTLAYETWSLQQFMLEQQLL